MPDELDVETKSSDSIESDAKFVHVSVENESQTDKDEKYYDDTAHYAPFGGAKDFNEIDVMREAQDTMMRMDMVTDQLRGIIHNITCDDEMDVDQKARAIQSAADEYRKRISQMSAKALGNKSFLSSISTIFVGDKRRKKWPYKKGDKDDEEEEKEIDVRELPTAGGFKVYRDKQGKNRWLSMSSNAFEDLDRELFTTDALKEAVEYADKSGERGPLLVFHVPTAEIGQCDYQAVVGRFLVESGTFGDTPLGRKAVEYFANTDKEHQVSIGYIFERGDEADGVYDWLRVVERSVLPKGDAANPWTDFQVIGGKALKLDQRHQDALKSIFGEELSAQVISAAEEKTKELEGKVRFKEARVSVDDEGKPQIAVVMEDETEPAAAQEDSKESEEGAKEESEENAAEESKAADGAVVELAGVVSQLKDIVEGLASEVKELKKSDDEKIASIITPKAANGMRPTEDAKNVIDTEKAKEITGDKESDLPSNPALPYVMDLIGPRSS